MGNFSGAVETAWSKDGRNMTVLKDLTFTDKSGKVWTAKKGDVVNGASIPRFAWHLVGSPFVGKYRRASVIHDVYCTTKSEPWQAVHKVFNEMMTVDGVPWLKRLVMFRAVWFFGPRWEIKT